MAGANVLPIIDTSASMYYSGYVDTTKTDSEAFVRAARPGDRIGVVSYDTNGRVTYPPNGSSLVEVDFSLKQTREAADAIEALSFMGDCTNIGGGILTGRTLMDPAPFPKGLVLLSDGYQNCGTDPLSVLPPYPIYSCAMGPASDQNLMYEIARKTGGSYYYAPTVFDMMLIFNQIRGELDPSLHVVVNDLGTATPGETMTYPVPISVDLAPAQFSFVWNDPSVTYTSGAPGENQVQVTLTDPSGTPWPDPPQVSDPGYVIFNIAAAAQGDWTLAAQFGQTVLSEIPVTAAAFESEGTIALQFNPDGGGDPASFFALTQNGRKLDGAAVDVERVDPLAAIYAETLAQTATGAPPSDTPPEAAELLQSGAFEGGRSTTYRAVIRGTTTGGITVQRTTIFTVADFA